MRINADRPGRVVIAHSSPLVVEGLASIATAAGFAVVDRCHDGEAARDAIRDHGPDIAVLGPRLGALELLRARRTKAAHRIVIVCDDLAPQPLLTAVEGGVDGLLLATAPAAHVGTCLTAVAAGRRWFDPAAATIVLDQVTSPPEPTLTRREREVAALVAAGKRNRTIADTLGISEGTVKMHLHNVYAKLGLESRTQLAMEVRAGA